MMVCYSLVHVENLLFDPEQNGSLSQLLSSMVLENGDFSRGFDRIQTQTEHYAMAAFSLVMIQKW